MGKFVCIHAHFYQPPRESPWTGDIELQESAFPYHDWNERITAECYSPNSASPILDGRGKVERTIDNYSKISFNFGPTLLYWMERHHPEVYDAILRADRESGPNFSGHGAAIAQVYNHMVMPLASGRDRRTQVKWGIADFESRFGRHPEGMWLPEMAVDTESIEILAEAGIKFTILSPTQAAKVRRIGEERWSNVREGNIDTKRAYQFRTKSEENMSIFFYDRLISRDVAFGDLLDDGRNFARRLVEPFTQAEAESQLVNIATDGETYGHHRRHGNMALAYCLDCIQSNELARLTNYGEFLETSPPQFEVQILENTSWSCEHGLGRWKGNCGCTSKQRAGWSQEWRAPLRQAMDWLRDNLALLYEKEASKYLLDPWKARDDYVSVILDQREDVSTRFVQTHSKNPLPSTTVKLILELLEMQRDAMLMFSSCGWFWDEISAIETVQVMKHARRAMQLARLTANVDLEEQFVKIIESARSNIRDFRNGGDVYRMLVRPEMVENTDGDASNL